MPEMIIQSPDDVIGFLKAQHNLIEDMFDQVLHASDPQAREKPFVQLRQLLAVHETAEEMVVHPRVRREVDAIDSIVDARLEEEHDAKELLSSIEKIDITSQQFIDELTKLRDAVMDHALHEESFEFPKLQRRTRRRGAQAAGNSGAGRGGHRTNPSACRRGIREVEFRRRALRVDD